MLGLLGVSCKSPCWERNDISSLNNARHVLRLKYVFYPVHIPGCSASMCTDVNVKFPCVLSVPKLCKMSKSTIMQSIMIHGLSSLSAPRTLPWLFGQASSVTDIASLYLVSLRMFTEMFRQAYVLGLLGVSCPEITLLGKK